MVRLVFRSVVALVALTVYSSSAGAHTQNQAGSSGDPRAGYTLVLVDTNSKAELAQARDFIVSQGGRVAIVLPRTPSWDGSLRMWTREYSDDTAYARYTVLQSGRRHPVSADRESSDQPSTHSTTSHPGATPDEGFVSPIKKPDPKQAGRV